jgi:Tol biopolymer transport system component
LLNPRTLLVSSDDGGWGTKFDWSPDGNWIAAAMWDGDSRDHNHVWKIALIKVAGGSVTVLKSSMADLGSIFFSPDGRYIAYDVSSDDPSQRDVCVFDRERPQDTRVVAHGAESLMGWSPNGTQLLFSSNRRGSTDLFRVTLVNGNLQGFPELVKSGIGPGDSLGLTLSGALYVAKHINSRDIAIAAVDLDAGRLLGAPSAFTQGFVDGADQSGSWSPDGQFLAVRCQGGCLAIRSTGTGQVVRRLATTLTLVRWPSWSSDGQTLFARGIDRDGRQGIFRIDVRSGGASPVIMDERLSTTLAQPSPDGQKIYFNRRQPAALVERDMTSGVERTLSRVRGGRYQKRLAA